MYKNVKILNPKEHSFFRYQAPDNLFFAKDLNIIPISFSEVKLLCCDFPIVVIGEENNLTLAILTGHKKNSAVDEKSGKWIGEYLPAFLRRYPFIFVEDKEKKTLHFGFDMESGCFNSPEGEALFDMSGNPSKTVTTFMKFLESYGKEIQLTTNILNRLYEIGVLEQAQYKIEREGQEEENIGGFMVFNKEKQSKLDRKSFLEIAKNNWYELIELEILSLKNIKNIR